METERRNSLMTVALVLQPMGAGAFWSFKHHWEGIHDTRAEKLVSRTKAMFSFNLLPFTHRCSINTQIGDNVTDRKRCRFRFRSNINAPLKGRGRGLNVKLNIISNNMFYPLIKT